MLRFSIFWSFVNDPLYNLVKSHFHGHAFCVKSGVEKRNCIFCGYRKHIRDNDA